MTFAAAIGQAENFSVNRLHRSLSDQSVRRIVQKYASLAGLEQIITPHMFRHSFVTLLEKDADIRYIRRVLGYSSIVTTQIYAYVAGRKQRDILPKTPQKSKVKADTSRAKRPPLYR